MREPRNTMQRPRRGRGPSVTSRSCISSGRLVWKNSPLSNERIRSALDQEEPRDLACLVRRRRRLLSICGSVRVPRQRAYVQRLRARTRWNSSAAKPPAISPGCASGFLNRVRMFDSCRGHVLCAPELSLICLQDCGFWSPIKTDHVLRRVADPDPICRVCAGSQGRTRVARSCKARRFAPRSDRREAHRPSVTRARLSEGSSADSGRPHPDGGRAAVSS
jgi:hypothetical protein